MKFHYSDGGRSNYFKATNVGDCVTRAICNATGKDYKEELQQYLMWRRRGSVVLAKKGKGAKYNRQKMKVKNYTWE